MGCCKVPSGVNGGVSSLPLLILSITYYPYHLRNTVAKKVMFLLRQFGMIHNGLLCMF